MPRGDGRTRAEWWRTPKAMAGRTCRQEGVETTERNQDDRGNPNGFDRGTIGRFRRVQKGEEHRGRTSPRNAMDRTRTTHVQGPRTPLSASPCRGQSQGKEKTSRTRWIGGKGNRTSGDLRRSSRTQEATTPMLEVKAPRNKGRNTSASKQPPGMMYECKKLRTQYRLTKSRVNAEGEP